MTHRDGFPRLSASTRVARRCKASQALRPVHKNWAVRKPWETAVPVAQANRQRANRRRASESLADVPHRPRLPSYPARRLHDLYGSLSTLLGITIPGTSAFQAIMSALRPNSGPRRRDIGTAGVDPFRKFSKCRFRTLSQ